MRMGGRDEPGHDVGGWIRLTLDLTVLQAATGA
jgi:hypothetical protein